ncbi:Predicted metal-dependent phosphohydrolase, HD superfamily [Chitinophaga costaii]|uniref:Predicted metal-dependent phosphohydrolase, HD superfamily n=1 Tax=Chitinophaga costaii TaxID=1335309 RepID=A0A1C4F1H5_9BACT|nr:Pycsar system effector family protein [Chitinophaga costaii]PUZ22159.1 HD domain-containing protein [Chitinophaga costaii]SCC49632.1 Predicted metal-dependent phosphohydrolase, HD superfamily [Chitinophaga costaii]
MEAEIIISAAKQYVTREYTEHPHPTLVYHNLMHTQQVVKMAAQLAAHYHLSDEEMMIVMVAAWFHDIGYLYGEGKGHENRSADIARTFLAKNELPEHIQQQVAGCIQATQIPQNPTTLLEQIVCDADLAHLGSKDFKDRNKLLRHEIALVFNKDISGEEWTAGSIAFLESHTYHTAYANALLRPAKEENLQKLRDKLANKLAKHEKEQPVTLEEVTAGKAGKAKEGKKDKKEATAGKQKEKAAKPDRGVETMFRTTSTNHIRLSSMADSKAHIMISVNSIIISILLSVLFRKLDDYPNLVIPGLIFLATSVTTIVFSVLATRPNVNSGTFSKDDIENQRTNLLFFGNFHKMPLEDYQWGMTQMMNNSEYLYGSMIKDIYYLGVVLGKKYRLLHNAYNVFMFGLILSVLAFIVAAIFFPVRQ